MPSCILSYWRWLARGRFGAGGESPAPLAEEEEDEDDEEEGLAMGAPPQRLNGSVSPIGMRSRGNSGNFGCGPGPGSHSNQKIFVFF